MSRKMTYFWSLALRFQAYIGSLGMYFLQTMWGGTLYDLLLWLSVRVSRSRNLKVLSVISSESRSDGQERIQCRITPQRCEYLIASLSLSDQNANDNGKSP